LESEWASFKSGVEQAQQEQQRKAALQRRQQLFDELGALIRPPQPQPVQPIYYLPSEGTGQLGYVDFDAKLMSAPLRWFI
jgi:hypothetical protein